MNEIYTSKFCFNKIRETRLHSSSFQGRNIPFFQIYTYIYIYFHDFPILNLHFDKILNNKRDSSIFLLLQEARYIISRFYTCMCS